MRRIWKGRSFVFSCLVVMSAMVARADEAAVEKAKASFRVPAPSSAVAPDSDPVWRLGRSLFFEPSLSASGHIACVTCHAIDHAWSDGRAHDVGDAGRDLASRTPTLLGIGKLHRFGWTGRFRDMAAVTTFAISSPTNMAQPLASAAARLRDKPDYVAAFREAYGAGDPDGGKIVHALTVFVGSIEATGTPFDHWIDGDENAVSSNAKRGFAVFVGKGGCSACHAGPSLTDGSFHDIGSSTDDLGRGALFKTSLKLQHAFKTPSLRGVSERAPYMHDGSRATLEDVVDLYDRGGIERPSRADEIKPLHLSGEEKADLVAFLKTLSGETRFAVR